jgi:putative chitinase
MKIISKNEINKFIPLDLQQKYGLNKQRLAMFLAQITHESNCLQNLEENFNYSVSGLLKTFPKYFDEETAKLYGRTSKQKANQEMIANIAYANRMGNGDVESGDGYKYRGRGTLQITGKENYILLMMVLGIDCVEHPELLTKLPYSIQSALWYWDQKKCNQYCPDIETVTKKINGGLNGLEERAKLYQAYLLLLGAK